MVGGVLRRRVPRLLCDVDTIGVVAAFSKSGLSAATSSQKTRSPGSLFFCGGSGSEANGGGVITSVFGERNIWS